MFSTLMSLVYECENLEQLGNMEETLGLMIQRSHVDKESVMPVYDYIFKRADEMNKEGRIINVAYTKD